MLLAEVGVALRLQVGGIFRDAHVEGLASAHNVDEGLHSLFDGRHAIVAVAIEYVHVIQSHTPEALVARSNEVLARGTIAVNAGPHAMPGLGRDEEFVAVAG